jgi:hypothetical protein
MERMAGKVSTKKDDRVAVRAAGDGLFPIVYA